MRFYASVMKSLKENLRDWKVLVLVLTFSPFFVLLMYLFYGGEPVTYQIGMINQDQGKTSQELIEMLQNIQSAEGFGLYEIHFESSEDQLKTDIKEKTIDLGMVIPADYSERLQNSGQGLSPAVVTFFGSMSNPRYTVAAVMAYDVVFQQGVQIARISLPSTISESFLETKQPLNEFEAYVPGLISLAVLMILFPATASIVKENEKKTLIRLKLSSLGVFNFLGGMSLVQAVVAVGGISLAYWAALGLGYRPAGTFGPVLLVGILSSFSMVSISLVVASFLNTVFDVLTVGCFPFFILMFFSGGMFPLPEVHLFTLGGFSFGIADLLPLTQTTKAFNQILNYGAGIKEVWVEILMIGLLTVFYFGIGLVLYQKRKFSKAW